MTSGQERCSSDSKTVCSVCIFRDKCPVRGIFFGEVNKQEEVLGVPGLWMGTVWGEVRVSQSPGQGTRH